MPSRVTSASGAKTVDHAGRAGRGQPLRMAGAGTDQSGQRDLADEGGVRAGGAMPVAADASAAAIARSHAGSSTFTPPDDAPNSSERPSESPRDPIEHRRHQLESPSVEAGRLPPRRAVGRPDERLDLDGEGTTARPCERGGGAGHVLAAQRAGSVGSIARSPPAPISNQALSPSAPYRFLPPASTRRPDRGVAVEA